MNPAVPNSEQPTVRLASLDVLRGFDMFWILGADAVVLALGAMSGSPLVKALAAQMEHKPWAGFAFYDLIFPLFIFISGVSLVFALPKTLATLGRAGAIRRILLRATLLFLLGILYNGGLAQPWPEVRIVGVLQRIAVAYAVTGVLFCCFRLRTCLSVGAFLLVGYWALLTFVPIRNVALTREALAASLGTTKPTAEQVAGLYAATSEKVVGGYERGLNLANHLDYEWLPGGKYQRYWDPEGILSTLPAIATCLLGLLAGHVLKRSDRSPRQKVRWLAIAGAVSLVVGWTWHLQFPVVKDLWSSSFVLVAGGWSFWLLGLMYYVVDIREWRGWCAPFQWVGMNPITLYLATSLVGFGEIARKLMGGSVAAWLDGRMAGLGELSLALTSLGLLLLLARFLYRRKIFIRV